MPSCIKIKLFDTKKLKTIQWYVTSDEFLSIFPDLSMAFWPLENLKLILNFFEKNSELNFDLFFFLLHCWHLLTFWLISSIFWYAQYLKKKIIFVVSQSEKEIVNQDKWWKYLEQHWSLTFCLNSLIQFFEKIVCKFWAYLFLRIWSQRNPFWAVQKCFDDYLKSDLL